MAAGARDYERKISGLMQEVASLRDQTSDKIAVEDQLNQSEQELRDTKLDLLEKERENRRLQGSMDNLRGDLGMTQ